MVLSSGAQLPGLGDKSRSSLRHQVSPGGQVLGQGQAVILLPCGGPSGAGDLHQVRKLDQASEMFQEVQVALNEVPSPTSVCGQLTSSLTLQGLREREALFSSRLLHTMGGLDGSVI